MSLYRIAKLTFLVIVCILFIWILSPATIVPPADTAEALTIYIADYGLHSELVLPSGNGELIQYAYGDWNYFALNQQDLKNGATALFIPTQGTLGRQKFSNIVELQQIIQQQNYTLLSLVVARNKVTQLLQLLDQRFSRNISTKIENSQTGLTLVKDERDYTFLHNSNHEIVEWLRALDCQIYGFVMWANFRVKHS
ncbi:MAG: DUF2459 domain-containing protein [Richelia sp. RM2_1_2]|nr:DUF2459 domain-containing protein [Richelia sp. SM2_1_7]NJM20536.1 DUF2459 domain-containing protein [Richelia sp. SM1_7_0]NJO27309.1 DUF2459 domain-containing protein [Richelia sp. SL_2_1]NJO59464.1 DUF2459 domain-containing protein [Richelia sp. RM2_1_2]